MDTNSKQKIKNGFLAYPAAISLVLYVFFYQLAYPFSSTVFLYISFALFAVWLIVGSKVYLSVQMLLMGLVTLVSVLGTFYTNNSEKGNREAILTAVTLLFLVVLAQDGILLYRLKKLIYFFSVIVLIGVMLQFLIGDTMNTVLRSLLRADSYEHLMWSYTVDKAYAGFSAYTVDAAYFCATLFGFVFFEKILQKSVTGRKKIVYYAVMILSIFCIFLTSKRGIAVALLIALIVTYLAWEKVSAKTIIGIIILISLCGAILYVLYDQNAIVHAFFQRFDLADGDLTTGRGDIWKEALDGLQNDIFGMGTGSAYRIYDTGLHNIYLQLFYDHGIVGAGIYIVFFLYNLRLAIKRKEPMQIYIQMLMLVYGMSGNPIYSNSFFIVYVIFSVVTVEKTNTECLRPYENEMAKHQPFVNANCKEGYYHESGNPNIS